MADRIGLNAYVVQMRKRYGDIQENKLGGAHDATQIFFDYFTSRKGKTTKLAQGTKAFEVEMVERDDTIPAVFGVIQFGAYGRSGTLKHVDDGHVTHNKGNKESEFSPRYFRLHFPNDRSRAVMLIQQNGSDGTKQALELDFRGYTETLGFTLSMNPLTHGEMLTKYLQHGEAKSIRVTRHVPGANADEMIRNMRIDGEGLDPGAIVEVVVRHPGVIKRIAATALSVANKSKTAHDLIEVAGLTYDDVSVDVKLGGQTRRMSLTGDGGAAMRYDVSKEVTLDAGGHPQFASIDHCEAIMCRFG